VRVALTEQDEAGGGVDRLFDEALTVGAEDFDQVPGTGGGVEVEVPSHPAFVHFPAWSHQSERPLTRSCVPRTRWES